MKNVKNLDPHRELEHLYDAIVVEFRIRPIELTTTTVDQRLI